MQGLLTELKIDYKCIYFAGEFSSYARQNKVILCCILRKNTLDILLQYTMLERYRRKQKIR